MNRLRQTELLRSDVAQEEVGALCWRRRRGAVQVLLVTSRGTGRWVIPKGWPIPGLMPAAVAAREAWEEAGVRGTVADESLGVFSDEKVVGADRAVPGTVAVHARAVETVARTWPERRERDRLWLAPAEAALRVREAGLPAIIAAFDPGPAAPRA